MSQSIILGYWGIRGRAQVIRLLLSYTGVEWTQKKYYSKDQWKGIGKDQTSLGLPFPNLPYLIHDQFKLTESKAIMRYVINISDKKDLLGKTIQDQALISNIVSVFTEIQSKIIELVFENENFQQKKSQIERFIDSKCQSFEHNFDSKSFIFGYLTLADFIVAEASYYIEHVFPQVYQKYRFLSVIRRQFESVEQIKSYYKGENSVKGPFLPPIGKIKF